MTATLITLGILAFAAAYLVIGWTLAMRDMPNAWSRARREWAIEEHVRDSVRAQTLLLVFGWPVLFPLGEFLSRLDSAMTERDPRVLKRRLDERDRRIAELERELEIR